MTVVVSNQETGPWRRELRLEVPAEQVDQAIGRVAQEYARHAKIPGFRPGKVPRQVILQRFRSEIEEEVKEHLVPRAWEAVQETEELQPLVPPQLAEIGDLAPGAPLTMTVVVEVRPDIELGDVESFTLPEPPTEPTDEEIDQALDELRKERSSWATVERAATPGDQAVVEVREITEEAAEGDEETGETPAQTIEIEIGDDRVWEELSDAVTGLAAGESAEFSRDEEQPAEAAADADEDDEDEGEPADEDTEAEAAATRTVTRRFKLEVKEVKERELPELDDAFAGEVADFETVDEMRQAVADHIERQKEDHRRRERENALLDQLRERHPLTLPEGAVRAEVEDMLQEYARSLAQQGVDVENADLDWQSMGEQIRPAAEKKLHARLILDAIAKEKEVEVDPQRVYALVHQIAQQQGEDPSKVFETFSRDGRLGQIHADMVRARTVRILLGDEPEEPEAEDDDAEDDAEDDDGADAGDGAAAASVDEGDTDDADDTDDDGGDDADDADEDDDTDE